MSLVRTNCSPPIDSSAAESLARAAQVTTNTPIMAMQHDFSRSMIAPLHRYATYGCASLQSIGRDRSRQFQGADRSDRRSVGCRLRLPSTIDPVSSFSRFSIASFEFHRSSQLEPEPCFAPCLAIKSLVSLNVY